MNIFERLEEKHGSLTMASENLKIARMSLYNWKNGSHKINGKNAEKIAKDLNLAISTVKRSINKREE